MLAVENEELLVRMAEAGLSARTVVVLNHAARGSDASWSNIHAHLHCSRVAVYNILRDLQKDALIHLVPKPWGRLSRRVEITDDGRELLDWINGDEKGGS